MHVTVEVAKRVVHYLLISVSAIVNSFSFIEVPIKILTSFIFFGICSLLPLFVRLRTIN